MKFQNPSFEFFLNGRTNKRTDKPKAICSPLFQSWGHNEKMDPKEHYPQTANHIALFYIEFRSHCTIFSVKFLPCDRLDLIYLW